MFQIARTAQGTMTTRVSPGQATFLFSVGTGLASVLANFIASKYADRWGGINSNQLLVGIGLTFVGTLAAVWIMGRGERIE